MPRYWTVEAARAALPEARRLVSELRSLLRRQAAGQTQPQRLIAGRSVNGHGPAHGAPGFETAVKEAMERIQAMQFQVKDVEAGLIDFPYLRHSEAVLLCYREGEPDILFWHDLEGGFAGRRPLSEL
jgi:hypothetical protein